MKHKVLNYDNGDLGFGSLFDSYRGWQAYARWANTHKLRGKIKMEITAILMKRA